MKKTACDDMIALPESLTIDLSNYWRSFSDMASLSSSTQA